MNYRPRCDGFKLTVLSDQQSKTPKYSIKGDAAEGSKSSHLRNWKRVLHLFPIDVKTVLTHIFILI